MNRCIAALVAFATSAVPAVAQTDWQRVPLIEHMRFPSFTFDTTREVAVLFGGQTKTTFTDTTWVWDRVSWQQATTLHHPPARYGAAMVFDAARGVVLLFGGFGANGVLGDTWQYDGVDWTQLSPPLSPSPRYLHAMVYDAPRSSVLLFGGNIGGGAVGETWLWDGVTWTKQAPQHEPGARFGTALACDSLRQRVVMFGGGSGGPYVDTWEWDGVDWIDRTSAVAPWPSNRAWHGMSYDAARARTVLFGGSDEPGHYKHDTWEWDGAGWVDVTQAPLPTGRFGFGQAYDPGAQRTLVFGGEKWLELSSDLSAFDGLTWQNAAAPTQPPMHFVDHTSALAFDGDRGVVVWFGSAFLGGAQTWEYDGQLWSRRSLSQPLGGRYHHLQWLPTRHRVVLYQPLASNPPDQTWEYDGVQWTQVATAHWPGVGSGTDVALAPDFARLILFGGRDPQGLRGSTWSFAGSDWQQVANTGPSPREDHAMALDAQRGRVVLFGGHDGTSNLADTWEWDGQQWLQRQPATVPPARRLHVMAYDLARRRIVMHGGTGQPGWPNATWEWDGVDWRQRLTAISWQDVGHYLTHDFWRGESIAVGAYTDGTWRYAPVSKASFTVFGSGCGGSAGTPSIGTPLGELPYSDGTFTVAFSNLPDTVAFATAGFSATTWNGVPLPLDLQLIGYPGCELLVAAESVVTLPVSGGIATWSLTLPPAPALVGTSFYEQALAFDPAGPTGLAVTPAGEFVIGGR